MIKKKKANSNISSRSIKYSEMQRKLYNNFNVKSVMDFEKFSHISKVKPCECEYKNKSNNQLHSLNNVHDNYLSNLNAGCAGAIGVCAVSSTVTKIAGATATAAAKDVLNAASTETLLTQWTKFLAVINLFSKSAVESAITSTVNTVSNFSLPLGVTAETAATAASTAFFYYGIAIVMLIAVIIIVIYLYVWLRERRKNSFKHEYKKHLFT